jgi:hypothetical protein
VARKRMLDPGIWESAFDKKWDVYDFVVMISAISAADDEGRGRVSMIKRNMEPMIDNKKFKKSLTKLRQSIVIYEKIYYYLPKFGQYQVISKPRPSKYPKPNILNNKDLTQNFSHTIPEPFPNRSVPSEVKVSEVNRIEINRSEVKGPTHIDFKKFFSLFTLTFGQEPNDQEKRQLKLNVEGYIHAVPVDEQFKILRELSGKIKEGNKKIQTRAYFYGVFKRKLQDYCAAKSIEEAEKLKNQYKSSGEK